MTAENPQPATAVEIVDELEVVAPTLVGEALDVQPRPAADCTLAASNLFGEGARIAARASSATTCRTTVNGGAAAMEPSVRGSSRAA